MSSYLVIRHGQASYGSANYDELSRLGVSQSEKLGAYLARQSKKIDAIYVGPKKRHEQTCEALRKGASKAGMTLPDPIESHGLDEFPAFELFRMHYPTEGDSSDAALAGNAEKQFPALVLAWMKGEIDSGSLENATQFEARVQGSFSEIRNEQGMGKRILMITSGGPMMIAVKQSLMLNAYNACKLLWVTGNSALSEFRSSEKKLVLHSFNSLAHLSANEMSYR